jgi:NAD+ kinase
LVLLLQSKPLIPVNYITNNCFLKKVKSLFTINLYVFLGYICQKSGEMRVAVFGKSYSDGQKSYLQLLMDELAKRNAEISIYEPFYKTISNEINLRSNISKFNTNKDIKGNIDVLFSVGGDGTMLDTVPIIRNSGIPIFGINLGRLGFLSSVSKHEISDAVKCIFSGDYNIDKRALLQLKKPKNLFGNVNYALNDLTIYRNNATALVTVHVYVDDLFLNSYWGDGLIVSTPTGSTAYSMSVGGPIVTPGSKNFIIAPIASHNLTVRPIILQDSSTIRIKIDGREEKHLLTLDSKISAISREDEIIIKRCNFTVNLIQMKNKNFYSTIRDKLYWGKDNRN